MVHAACVNIIPLLYKYLILGQSVQFIFMNNKINVWGLYEKITQFYLAIFHIESLDFNQDSVLFSC